MEILKSLDQSDRIERYEVQDYKRWLDGYYYRFRITFTATVISRDSP